MSNISFTSDIIREAAEQTGYTEKQVEHVYATVRRKLKHIFRHTDACSVSIPHLGVLHVKAYDVERNLRNAHIKEDEEKKTVFESKLDKLVDLVLDYKLSGVSFGRIRHFQRRREKMHYYTSYKTLTEIENKQNEENK